MTSQPKESSLLVHPLSCKEPGRQRSLLHKADITHVFTAGGISPHPPSWSPDTTGLSFHLHLFSSVALPDVLILVGSLSTERKYTLPLALDKSQLALPMNIWGQMYLEEGGSSHFSQALSGHRFPCSPLYLHCVFWALRLHPLSLKAPHPFRPSTV